MGKTDLLILVFRRGEKAGKYFRLEIMIICANKIVLLKIFLFLFSYMFSEMESEKGKSNCQAI
ncbi:hypothetical protein [Hungatella hathewayi]|uniref:hypothetical protein n=1 Tax=Hungatella hathewayi TaxID=154046 RepID=UPI0035671DE9